MKAGKLSLKYVPIDSLKENPDNARDHGSEIEELVQSIDRFGFAGVIKVDKSMTIISGHGRLIAAKKNGLKEVPVIILPFNKEEAKAFALIDNKTSDDSTWIWERYDKQVKDLTDLGWDMESFGFVLPEFEDLTPAADEGSVEIPEPPARTPKTDSKGSLNVMVYCRDQDDKDKVVAFLLENEIPCQVYE
jgi:site-specific DNA-methyltransferase (adenine-specific)